MRNSILMAALICMAGCSTFKVKNDYANAYQSPLPAPFENELDQYQKHMGYGKSVMLAGIVSAALFSLSSTLILNFGERWGMNETLFRSTLYPSYALSAAGFGLASGGFYKWKNNSEKYLETLRLQSQYFNLLSVQQEAP